jgi:YHS domain-containing protein
MKKYFSILIFALLVLTQSQAQAVFTDKSNIAINGYDAVSYFSGKPQVGKADITVTYKGAIFRFATAENKAAFEADTEKYAPQYGGWCAYGWANGYPAKTDPQAWTIVNDKLYLNYNAEVKTTWDKDQTGYIKKANANWSKKKKEDKQK